MALDPDLLEMVALLETPTGFAFFNVRDWLCKGTKNLWSWFAAEQSAMNVIFLLEFVKFDDKSVVRQSDGPGSRLAFPIRKYCGDRRPLIVGDDELRHIIKSNLNVMCFEDKDVIDELMWGLRNALFDFVYQERDSITREYLLPLPQGFKNRMSKFGINISTEIDAADRTFICYAGALHRCDILLKKCGKNLREECDALVPDIGEIIKDDTLYAEVMSKILNPPSLLLKKKKILTPQLVKEWDPSEWFPADVVQKIEAVDAAADDARKKVDHIFCGYIQDATDNLRRFPGLKTALVQNLINDLAEKQSEREKRSHTEIAEGTSESDQDEDHSRSEREKRSHTEVAEGTSGQDEDHSDAKANGVCGKKVRVGP